MINKNSYLNKISIIILVLALVTFCIWGAAQIFAKDIVDNSGYYESKDISINFSGDEFYEDFTANNPVILSGTPLEVAAGDYIAAAFSDIGLEYYMDNDDYYQEFEYLDSRDKKTYSSRNIIGYLPSTNGATEQIIIGAHYDNYTKDLDYDDYLADEDYSEFSYGANNNAAGIATLYQTALTLSVMDRNVNIILVAFGAEELGLHGSTYLAKSLDSAEVASTILMINVDSIISDDNLYLYTGEVKNSASEFFVELAEDNDILLKLAPSDKYVTLDTLNSDYWNLFMLSDNKPFMDKGIEVASFLGANEIGAFSEPNDIMELDGIHTAMDRQDELSLKGRVRVYDTSSMIVAIVSNSDIVSIMKTSAANKYNYRVWLDSDTIMYVNYTVKATILFTLYIIAFKLGKKTKPENLPKPIVNHNNTTDKTTKTEENEIFKGYGI